MANGQISVSTKQHPSRSASGSDNLPPCRVCHKNGTGLHYGVITCEACKGFFRRNNKASTLLQCSKNGNCNVALYSGSFCSKCRYQKCIEVGMSETAIKKGRYTTQRRTRYILEVAKDKESTEETKIQNQGGQFDCYPDESRFDHDAFIQILQVAHATHVPSLHYITETKGNEMQWQYHSRDEMYISLVDLLKCADNYHDPDDQLHYIQREITTDLESKLRWYITFLKCIPGFSELSPSDQAQLLKQGRYEFFFLETFPGYNIETKLVCPSINKCFHMDDLSLVWGQEFMTEEVTFAQTLRQMDISLTEVVLLEVICVLSADRGHLQEPRKVEFLQWQAVVALIHHQYRSSASPMLRFAQLLDRVTAMRTLTEWNSSIVRNFCHWPLVQNSSLLMEIFDV